MRPSIALAVPCGRSGRTKPVQRMEVTLERQEGDAWKTVDPGFVFDKGDRVRFRFRANFDGYLYVMNYGTSGKHSLLFPREETGRDNRIAAGKEYRIPATEAWFRIDGPPGHDVVYWLVSPLALAERGCRAPSAAEGQAAAKDTAAPLRRLHLPRPRAVHRLQRRAARRARDRGTARESEGRSASAGAAN